ncbi:hypothetical protein PMAYCL1PPCAC_24212, partial [Pristionchus mayeri]
SGFASEQIIFQAFSFVTPPTFSSSVIGAPAGLGAGPPSAMGSYLADLPVKNPDSFTSITKNVKKMPVQLSLDKKDAKVIKNTKESLLIQYLERRYELQPGGTDTPAYRLKKSKEEERKKTHKRKRGIYQLKEETEGEEERPSSSKSRRVEEGRPS